jgi:hypothetical protein
MHLDHRRFIYPGHVVLMEIALLDASALDGDFAFHRRAESEDDGAADLLLHDGGIDNLAAIGGADCPMNFQLALRHGDFGNLGCVAADVIDDGHSVVMPCGKGLTPSCLFGRQIQDAEQARLSTQ